MAELDDLPSTTQFDSPQDRGLLDQACNSGFNNCAIRIRDRADLESLQTPLALAQTTPPGWREAFSSEMMAMARSTPLSGNRILSHVAPLPLHN